MSGSDLFWPEGMHHAGMGSAAACPGDLQEGRRGQKGSAWFTDPRPGPGLSVRERKIGDARCCT